MLRQPSAHRRHLKGTLPRGRLLQGDPGISGETPNAEMAMVRLTTKHPIVVYRVLDRDGGAIGEVRQPKAAPVVGWGAETVLLVREQGGWSPELPDRATAA